MKFAGIIIAGGKATRIGGMEKLLLQLGETSILDSILGRVTPQVDLLAVNVRDSSRRQYEGRLSHQVAMTSDPFEGTCGPLGGVIAGLIWMASLGEEFQWLATFPGDTPFLPRNLVSGLGSFLLPGTSRPVVAADRARIQSLCALWPATCLHELIQGVQLGGLRSVRMALDEFDAIQCPFRSTHEFMNINTPRDLADAERMIEERQDMFGAN